MAMTVETMLLLAVLSLVVMLLRSEGKRPAFASTAHGVRRGRHAA